MKTGLFLVASGVVGIGLLVWYIFAYMPQNWWLAPVLIIVAGVSTWWNYKRLSEKEDTK